MDKPFNLRSIILACALVLGVSTSPAYAQSEASLLLSALPVASVVGAVGAVGGSAVAGAAAVSVLPVAFSVAGATLIVKAVEVTASGTVYLLERVSDGAEASVRVVGHGVGAVVSGVGSVVAVSVMSTGVLLSAAGEVLAYIPNEIGRALLHNEKVTY